MTHIQKTQIRFAMLYMRIEAAETQKELARLREVIGWLKYRELMNTSEMSLAYYSLLDTIASRKAVVINISQKSKRIANSHKNLIHDK